MDEFIGRRSSMIAAAALLLGCSSESTEAPDGQSQSQTLATWTITATMTVTTPQPPPLNEITFTITTPSAPLFLGTLKINAFPPGANGVIGSVDPGGANAQNPALHTFKMGGQFQQIRQFLINNQGQLSIQITYDSSSFLASHLNVMAML